MQRPDGADIWATTEFCVSIMVVACTALRPLLRTAWRVTRSSRNKPPSNPDPAASPPSGTTSRRTERPRSSLGDPFLDTDDGEDRANDGDSASVVGLVRLPPARTRPRDWSTSGSIGASELDRDLELGKPTDFQEFLPVPAASPGPRGK